MPPPKDQVILPWYLRLSPLMFFRMLYELPQDRRDRYLKDYYDWFESQPPPQKGKKRKQPANDVKAEILKHYDWKSK